MLANTLKEYLNFLFLCTLSLIMMITGVFAQERVVPRSQIKLLKSFSPVVKRAAPAVVNIYVRRRIHRRVSPFFDDPFFRRFFGRDRVQSSLGSGVIVKPDGIVVTNYHVIKGTIGQKTQEIKVVLSDKREFSATVILHDERTDLAVLKIDSSSKRFKYIEIEDSDNLEVGDIVLAIGNPFGVGQTVTSGIVSALARTQVGISDYQFFIQTDAAINPGNSGGALVNMYGKLVGINTAIFSRSGGSNGIGFAIPSNMAKLVVKSIQGGKVKRPWFGAKLQTITSDISLKLGLDRPAGALINFVYENSPAESAGLKTGDVIVSVDGKPVGDPRAFRYRFTTKGLNIQVPLNIIRNGKIKKVSVLTSGAPEIPPRNETVLKDDTIFGGATVVNLSPAVSEDMSLEDTKGVVITRIRPGAQARILRLRKNDIILRVNGRKIKSVKELIKLLRRKSRSWRFSIKRGNRIFSKEVVFR